MDVPLVVVAEATKDLDGATSSASGTQVAQSSNPGHPASALQGLNLPAVGHILAIAGTSISNFQAGSRVSD